MAGRWQTKEGEKGIGFRDQDLQVLQLAGLVGVQGSCMSLVMTFCKVKACCSFGLFGEDGSGNARLKQTPAPIDARDSN